MTNVAFIFPGQGTQSVGMGRELYEASPEAKAVIDRADEVIGNGLKSVMFEGPQEKLTTTAFCQPAILTASIAALKALEAHDKFKELKVCFTAGLSLGEYSALAASGALSFEDTLNLVRTRSGLMEEATKLQAGKMAAVIGFDKEKLVEICRKTGAQVANYNSLQQIVITGHAAKVEEAARLCKEGGAKNVVMLDVSGAFHSTLMQSAAEKFGPQLAGVAFGPAAIPIVSNVDAQPASEPEKIRENLAAQITSSVQWVDSVLYMAGQGVATFIEIGPGRVLKGLIRKIDTNLKVVNIEKPADIEALSI